MMVFIEEDGLDALLEDRVELGGNVSVAARSARSVGPGRDQPDPRCRHLRLLAEQGRAFAGIALDGTVITIDDSGNEVAFGEPVDGDAALDGSLVTPDIFAPFVDAVAAMTPRRREVNR